MLMDDAVRLESRLDPADQMMAETIRQRMAGDDQAVRLVIPERFGLGQTSRFLSVVDSPTLRIPRIHSMTDTL